MTELRLPVNEEADLAVITSKVSRALAAEQAPDEERVRILTVFMELARNIVKYAGRGEMRFRCSRIGTRIHCAVEAEDSGPGIVDIETAGELDTPEYRMTVDRARAAATDASSALAFASSISWFSSTMRASSSPLTGSMSWPTLAISSRMNRRALRAASTASAMIGSGSPRSFRSSWKPVMPFDVPAILQSMSQNASSQPMMSVRSW